MWMVCFQFQASVAANLDLNRPNDKSSLELFYDFLDSIRNETSEAQIASLSAYLDKNPDLGRAYISLLEIFIANGDIDEAKSYFGGKVGSSNNGYDEWMLAKILIIEGQISSALATIRIALDKNPDSIEMLEDFVEFIQLTDQPKEEGKVNLPNLEEGQQHILTALLKIRDQSFSAAFESLEYLPDKHRENLAFVGIKGYCLFKLKAFDEAMAEFDRGLSIAELRHDRYFQAIFLMRKGMIQVAEKNLSGALELYNSANATANQINSPGLLSKVNGNLGSFYFAQSDYSKALNAYRSSLKNAVMIGKLNEAAAWSFGKALALRSLKRYDEAVLSLEKSRWYSTNAKNTTLLTQVYLEKGNLFSSLSLNNLAIKEYERAYTLAARDSKLNENLRAFGGIASVLITAGKHDKARAILSDLLALDRNGARLVDKAYWKFKLAESYLLENRLIESKNAFQEVFDFTQNMRKSAYGRYVMASALLNIAEIDISMGLLAEAQGIFENELLIEVATERQDIKLDLNIGLGTFYLNKGLVNLAIQHFSSADKIFEDRRRELKVEQFRIGYVGREAKVIESMMQALVRLYEVRQDHSVLLELLRYSERNNARTLIEKKFGRGPGEDEYILREDRTDYERVVAKLTELQRRIRKNPALFEQNLDIYETLRYNLLSQRLTILSVLPRANDTEEVTLRLTRLREKALNSGITVLIYHTSNEVSFVLVDDGSKLKLVPLEAKPIVISSLMDSLLTPFHTIGGNLIQKTEYRAEAAYELYRLIFEPVENQTELTDQLLIIPDPTIAGLPFELLLSTKPLSPHYTPEQPADYRQDLLLYGYSFSYSPALFLAAGKEPEPTKDPRMLVVANPFGPTDNQSSGELSSVRPGWDSSKLWYSDVEADQIKAIHPNTTVYKRKEASKEIFKRIAGEYDVLHFATHAFIDSAFDAFSGLVLAMGSDSTDDGLLMGYEISDLALDGELITLSACRTGQGQLVAGEGVMGLPRLFLGAGANSVLMTLWQVDDKFTSELMPRFYDYLFRRHMTKAAALAEAKRDLIDQYVGTDSQYQHPFYWASFTLYGDPGLAINPQDTLPYTALAISLVILILLALATAYLFWFRKQQFFAKHGQN